MKKSTIIISLGIFIVVTVLLGTNTDKMYQKQQNFKTTSEIIEQLKNKPLIAIDEKGMLSETNDFKECLSERKRLTNSQLNHDKVEIEKVNELSEEKKQVILKAYEECRNRFSMRRVITKEEAVSFYVNVYYSYTDQGKLMNSEPKRLKLDLVLIDEGEGLVIDYIMESNAENLNEEGNKDA